ncbi:hypothetical protein, partial [Brachyspira catarrhinii]
GETTTTTPAGGKEETKKDLDITLASSSKGSAKTPVAIALSAKQNGGEDIKLEKETTASDAITFDGKDKSLDGLKFDIVKVEDDKTVTGQDLQDKSAGFPSDGKGFSVEENKIKIAKDTAITGNTDFGNSKKAGLKITIRISKDGYNPKDITVYALGTMSRS